MSTTDTSTPPAARGTLVELRDLTVTAGGRTLLEGAAASFEPGKVTLIVGCSGAGKSVLLRILAGLVRAGSDRRGKSEITASGLVVFDGRDALSGNNRVPIGVVFQNFALFDELSPTENVRFAQAHRASRKSGPAPADLLDELRVPRSVRTSSLSGGQRQRLAIARTLAYDPDVILYDEPTSGLDVATARTVADLIGATHATHPKTSIIVTHDYESLAPIADKIYLLDAATRSLREIAPAELPQLEEELKPPSLLEPRPPTPSMGADLRRGLSRAAGGVGEFLVNTSSAVEETLRAPLRLLPLWKDSFWGARYFLHYLRLVAGSSAWLYIAISGGIIGFVSTYFTFRFLPYANYTQPLLLENLLDAMGFALYRILVPVLVTILIAARCGAAVTSDVGGKSYGQQMDALRTFGVRPERYLLTGILYAFLIGTPVLTLLGFWVAKATSLVVFAATHPQRGPEFWRLHFHHSLSEPGTVLYAGSQWLLAKLLLCAAGIALVAYHCGARPKHSTSDVSRSITSTILWSTLYVLVVHFAFAFYEFE